MADEQPDVIPSTREIAAKVLARTASPRRAAKKAGIDLATLRAWQRDPEFQMIVLDVQTTNMMRTVIAVQNAAPIAAAALAKELQTKKPTEHRRGRPPKDPSVVRPSKASGELDPRRIRAAIAILELFPKYVEIGQLVQQIVELRAMLDHRSSEPVTVTALATCDTPDSGDHATPTVEIIPTVES